MLQISVRILSGGLDGSIGSRWGGAHGERIENSEKDQAAVKRDQAAIGQIAMRPASDMPSLLSGSKLLSRGGLDLRSREGRFVRVATAELVAHVGNPTRTQRALIDRLAWMQLHVALLDEQVCRGKPMSAEKARTYLALSHLIARGLRVLGFDEQRSPPPRSGGAVLDDHLAALAGEGAS
jgi:hypothetical protein